LKLVDFVKGVAIVLVVYEHVAQGVSHRGWWNSPVYFFQERFIYSFHMAGFFFVAGLFVQESIAKFGTGQFVVQKLRTVLWPYLFIGAFNIPIFLFGLERDSGAHDLVHAVLIPTLTGQISWFLPTLFLCLLLAVVTYRLPAWARFAAALALNLLWPENNPPTILDDVASYFVFLAAGEWVGGHIESVELIPHWATLAGSFAAFLLVAAGVWNPAIGRSLAAPLGLAGTLGLFLLTRGLRDSVFETAAVWSGVASLGIFVLHPFFQGATRVVLARLTSTHMVLPNVLIPTLVAVIGPGLLWHSRKLLHIGFLFEFPWGAAKHIAVGEKHVATVLASPG